MPCSVDGKCPAWGPVGGSARGVTNNRPGTVTVIQLRSANCCRAICCKPRHRKYRRWAGRRMVRAWRVAALAFARSRQAGVRGMSFRQEVVAGRCGGVARREGRCGITHKNGNAWHALEYGGVGKPERQRMASRQNWDEGGRYGCCWQPKAKMNRSAAEPQRCPPCPSLTTVNARKPPRTNLFTTPASILPRMEVHRISRSRRCFG